METAGISERDIESRLPRSTVVKNKSAAVRQVSTQSLRNGSDSLPEGLMCVMVSHTAYASQCIGLLAANVPRSLLRLNNAPSERPRGGCCVLCRRVLARLSVQAASVQKFVTWLGAQITSEQIVREAKELQEKDFKAPTQHISNVAELGEYRLRKRKEWEDVLRMKRWNLSIWAKVRACCLRRLPVVLAALMTMQIYQSTRQGTVARRDSSGSLNLCFFTS